MKNWIGLIVISVYIVIIMLASKFLTKKGEEISRKFVHIMLSNIWFLYLIFLDSVIFASILPIAFVIINTLSYKFKIFKTIEREENDGFGTIYYAVSVLLISIFTFLIKNPLIGLPGVLIMGYGDGFAAVLGQKIKSKKYKIGNSVKSVFGSFTMFIISLFITLIVFKILNIEYFAFKALGVSIVATILEAISIKGTDNLTVPIIITILTYLCI